MLTNQKQKSQKKLWLGILAITLPAIIGCCIIAGYYLGVFFQEFFGYDQSLPLMAAVAGFTASTLYSFKIIFDLKKRGTFK